MRKVGHTTFVIGGSRNKKHAFGRGALRLRSRGQVHKAIPTAKKGDLWVLFAESYADLIFKSVTWPVRKKLGDLLVLGDMPCSEEVALSLLFDRIAVTHNGATLPIAELAEVMSAENKRNLFVSGIISKKNGTLTLRRGDLTPLVVPLSAFRPTENDVHPDFDRFEIADYGQTLRFGPYEASADAVLYEYDPDYRRQLNAERRETEQGFGPSLRRLRMQKGLRQDQFAGLSAKTIARLERNRSPKPRPRTLDIIARHLGVEPEEIETY
jgi:hypothetical protein